MANSKVNVNVIELFTPPLSSKKFRELEQKLLTLASWGNGSKTDIVAVVTLFSYVLLGAT